MGSSRSTGGILHGNAFGNHLNHANFPKIMDIPLLGDRQVIFKVFVYLVYSDPVTIDVVPNDLARHNVSFTVSMVPPLDCALVLNRIADLSKYKFEYIDFINC